MEFIYNPDGSRNRSYRPYIYPEETTYNTSIYDPSRSYNFGMYDSGVPPGANSTRADHREFMNFLRDQEQDRLAWEPNTNPNLFPPNAVRSVYTPHNGSNGKQGMYKQLYAM